MSEIHPVQVVGPGPMSDYGLVVGGKDLMKLLGFKSYKSFHSACSTNRLPVPVFEIPGRKGKFARTEDLARWYCQLVHK